MFNEAKEMTEGIVKKHQLDGYRDLSRVAFRSGY